jgi:hypothetical protein
MQGVSGGSVVTPVAFAVELAAAARGPGGDPVYVHQPGARHRHEEAL